VGDKGREDEGAALGSKLAGVTRVSLGRDAVVIIFLPSHCSASRSALPSAAYKGDKRELKDAGGSGLDQIAPHAADYRVGNYPAPSYPRIIEPFAGSAGYSCRYHRDRTHEAILLVLRGKTYAALPSTAPALGQSTNPATGGGMLGSNSTNLPSIPLPTNAALACICPWYATATSSKLSTRSS